MNLPFETLVVLLESDQEDRLKCLVNIDLPATGPKELAGGSKIML